MDLESIKTAGFFWNIGNSAVLTFIAAYTWFTNRDKASRDAIKEVSETVHEVDNRVVALEKTMHSVPRTLQSVANRVTAVETSISHVPQKAEMNVVHKRITELAQSQNTVQGKVENMDKTLTLIHQFLLSSSRSNQP